MNSDWKTKLVFGFLKWIFPARLFEEIEGDLIQRFNRDCIRFGDRRAKRRLALSAIRFCRPGILLRNHFDYSSKRNFMFKNYTRLVVRQMGRNKIVSGVNIIGLTLAITVCLLIAQFVSFEYSFEKFNLNADHTYRINLYNTQNGVHTETSSATVPALAFSIRQSIPGIENIARVSSTTSAVVSGPGKKFQDREDRIVLADASAIDVLGVELIDGGKTKIIGAPNSVLISESIARKYFGKIEVTGNTLDFAFSNNSIESTPFEIRGVFKDLPSNTHANFQIVLPPNEQSWNENWAWSDVQTYIVLAQGVHPSSLDPGLAEIVKQHHQDGSGDKYLLEPLTDIRLNAFDGSGRAGLVNFFILLGGVILLLAWFNYTNLSTARFVQRMKEMGIRKLIGANRMQLVTQLLTETFLYNVISLSLAIILFFISWPHVSSFLNQNTSVTLFNDRLMFPAFGVLVCVSTLCSGFYPSLFLSSFKPVSSIKGIVTGIGDRSVLRKVIVTLQLSVSIALVTAVIVIHRQIEFMRSQDLGIAIDRTLVIEEPLVRESKGIEKYETLKNEMLKISSIKGVTTASSFPGKEIDWHRTDIFLGEENVGLRYDSRIIAIGTEFLDMFGVPLLAGRNFDQNIESDRKALLISEEAVKMFGFTNNEAALGKIIFIGSRRFEVIGVTRSYHYRTLQSKIEPVLYMQSYPLGPAFAVKLDGGRINETLPMLEKIWENGYPGNVFRYYFLDESFNRQYKAEILIGSVVKTLTALAIFIACSGLFALSVYSVGQRAKEISIRKIFGATLTKVVMLLSRETMILLSAGSVIAIPLVYYAITVWLSGYACKMPIDVWIFILPVIAVVILVMFAIGFQTISAARRNPVENMRHE